MQTTLIGYFNYTKEGKEKVMLTVLTNEIPSERGSGYYTKNFYCSKEQFPQITQNKPLKAGKVELETNAWNSDFLEKIYNI